MQSYRFSLAISSEKYLDYYRGTVLNVVARASDGQMVQFPASLLKPYVTINGIRGTFELTCDDNHKNPALARLG